MKKKLMRFNLAALALVMVTSVLISGTFAKYTTAVSAQDTALIARWDISSAGMSGEEIANLPLFEHAYDQAIRDHENGDGTGDPILGPGVSGSFKVNLTGTADVDAYINLEIDKIGTVTEIPIQYAIGTDENTVDWSTADIYYSEELLAEAILDSMVDGSAIIKNKTEEEEAGGTREDAGDNTRGLNPVILVNSTNLTEKDVWVHWRWLFDAEGEGINGHDQLKLKAALERDTNWTNADDTILGQESAKALKEGGARNSYGLKLTLKAEQITPEATNP